MSDNDRKNIITPFIKIDRQYTAVNANSETYIDDVYVEYYEKSLEEVLLWEDISYGQRIDAVTKKLQLPGKINFRGSEKTVSWKSSDTSVLHDDGTPVRSAQDKKVSLSAKVETEEIMFELTVAGTDGKTIVYLAGDSQTYSWPRSSFPKQGWGYYFADYFKGDTIVLNASESGRSTKTYYEDPALFKGRIQDNLKAGDFVLISLGTNDAAKASSGSYEYTDSYGEKQTISPEGTSIDVYKSYLKKMIEDVRAKNANPILVTMVNNGGTYDTWINYVNAMKEVSQEENVALVDLNKAHNDYIKSVKTVDSIPSADKEGSKVPEYVLEKLNMYNLMENFGASGDNDLYHFNKNGAKILARWVAQGIKKGSADDLKALYALMNEESVKATVYTAGDSIMFDWSRLGNKEGDPYYGYQGWGTYLKDYLTGANVKNTAYSGETTSSFFYRPNYMPTIRKSLKPGDYLIVSLGANDYFQRNNQEYLKNEDGTNIEDANGNPVKRGATVDEYAKNLKCVLTI